MKKSLSLVFFLLFAFSAFAEGPRYKSIGIIAEFEIDEMENELKRWKDSEVIKFFSQTPITEGDIKELYYKFKETIVTPPEPYSYVEYNMENPKEALKDTEQFARIIHNKLLALSKGAYAKYARLFGLIRELLYLDLKHLPFAIKQDDSRNIYWYILHNGAIKEIDKEYERLFGG